MTTIPIGEAASRATRLRARGSVMRLTLLSAGALSSLLYVAADVLGGRRYPGYDFTSQAVSELMAIGAPSEAFVDPLFLLYGLLALAFGFGVAREGARRNRPLRIAGVLLIAYAAIGFTGPTLFEMHQRGSGSPGGDTPHIILTAVLAMLQLAAIGAAAFALGKRFRVYSLSTFVGIVALGVASAPYSVRLAEGQPTPGFGILERILIYSCMLWVSVLAIALLGAGGQGSGIRGGKGPPRFARAALIR